MTDYLSPDQLKIRLSLSHVLRNNAPFKTHPQNNHISRYKSRASSTSPSSCSLQKSPVNLESRSSCLLGSCSYELRKRCAGANRVYSRTELVFILASKLFAAVCEAARILTRKRRMRQYTDERKTVSSVVVCMKVFARSSKT